MPDPTMIATAPGKLILSGEYAVLAGAPAVVIAVDRRAVARMQVGAARGSSPFLLAVAHELASRRGPTDRAARAALEIAVDSRAFYRGVDKLGLGSSAAVTVAATALALGVADRPTILEIASAAHASAQDARGSRGSGADIAAAVHGGVIVFTPGIAPHAPDIARRSWPRTVRLIPFYSGRSADTGGLVRRVTAARDGNPVGVDAAIAAITDASKAMVAALSAPAELAPTALIGALSLGAVAVDRLALATGIELVPDSVRAARLAMTRFGGTAKTTGAGGGDVAIAAVPATADVTSVTRSLIEAGCQPLELSLDEGGVDLRPDAS